MGNTHRALRALHAWCCCSSGRTNCCTTRQTALARARQRDAWVNKIDLPSLEMKKTM
jgi:hypothetical protein